MRQGVDIFGKQYGIAYRNDTHAEGSVDRVLFEQMIKLDDSSVEYLYCSYTDLCSHYESGDRAALEQIVKRLKRRRPSRTVDRIVSYCRKIVKACDTGTDDMIFGGTEEEIIGRGTYWCMDIARVACILFQIAGFPSRILVTANTNFAYCGHNVTEVYYDGKWGVADPTNGIVVRRPNGAPACAWEMHNDPAIANRVFYKKYPRWEDFFPPGEQYESVGISNYYADDKEKYSYETNGVNGYCREILRHSDERWAGGIRWIHGEDTDTKG